ncbi:glyoxalase [Chromatiales bacterium (ex Bugula neritina AB1)]|nr:glyoxalase [Chromatiales bacterium (ex Bugula neritina AB1)]
MSTISPNNTITIAFSVKDRKVTSAWYQEHLGFSEIFSVEEAGWTELATNTPGVTIGLGDAEEVQTASTTPVFGVADCDSSRAALEKSGIKFDGDTMEFEGMVKLATFYDPDGNALMIAEDLSS